jgi:prefoldin subunit 5
MATKPLEDLAIDLLKEKLTRHDQMIVNLSQQIEALAKEITQLKNSQQELLANQNSKVPAKN